MTDFDFSKLTEYGVLGLWTAFNIYLIMRANRKDDEKDTKLMTVIENNTIALTKVHEAIGICRYKEIIGGEKNG